MSVVSASLGRRFVAVAALAAIVASAAAAHTSYILPNVFSTSTGRMVTVQSAFAEDFFNPDVAVESEYFHVVRPDGTRDEFDSHTQFRQVVILEEALDEDGTYRLTTGPREGRRSRMRRVDGEWRSLEFDRETRTFIEPAPGVETAEFQTLTVADAYVTKGAPTDAALAIWGEGLELRPVTHPSEIYLEDGFELELLFNGSSMAQRELHLYRADGHYETPPFHQVFRTDAAGRAHLQFDRAGVYVVMLRHRAEAPADAATPYRSYTTSLTFEVVL